MVKVGLALVLLGAMTACGGGEAPKMTAPESPETAGHEGHVHDEHGHEAGVPAEGAKCAHGVAAALCADCASDSPASTASHPMTAAKCEHGVTAATCEKCKAEGHAH